MGRLENKVVLITGASRGQGAAEATLFAQEGASVYITDVLEEDGQILADDLTKLGLKATFIKLDVSSNKDWKNVIQFIMKNEVKIDVLVNNAGIARKFSIEQSTEELWDQVVAINQKGTFLGIKHVVPIMKKNGSGSIINVSSIAGWIGSRTGIIYGATKGAVRSITKSAAMELASANIRVNTIIPGPIDTLLLEDIGGREKFNRNLPLGRLGTSKDIASGALYLASDESSYVTGIDLIIDGGFTAGAYRGTE